MKVRHGFVSNSSSSSFICNVCGSECSGMDMGLQDAEMYECENGHTFCYDHIVKDLPEGATEDDDFDYYEIKNEYCPICMLKVVSDDDLVEYLVKSTGITKSTVFEQVKLENKRRKKLYSADYITYATGKVNKTRDELANEVMTKFKNYDEFYNYFV